jgi:hypothetical protein
MNANMQNQENFTGYFVLISSLRARFVFFGVAQAGGVELFVRTSGGATSNYCRVTGDPAGYAMVDRSTLVLMLGVDAVLDAESYVSLVNAAN